MIRYRNMYKLGQAQLRVNEFSQDFTSNFQGELLEFYQSCLYFSFYSTLCLQPSTMVRILGLRPKNRLYQPELPWKTIPFFSAILQASNIISLRCTLCPFLALWNAHLHRQFSIPSPRCGTRLLTCASLDWLDSACSSSHSPYFILGGSRMDSWSSQNSGKIAQPFLSFSALNSYIGERMRIMTV